jgi:hypothetical protein
MKALHFMDGDETGHYELDLDGAFNDGYSIATNSVAPALGRWILILWSAAAWGVGSYVLARSILEGFAAV